MAKTTGMRYQLLALTVAAALAPALAGAQDLPPAPTLGTDDLPAPESILAPSEATELGGDASMTNDAANSGVSLGVTLGEPTEYDFWDAHPPIMESSGTWLNRGFWYSQVEAVVMGRKWNKDNVGLAVDSGSTRILRLGRSDPGREGSLRFTLGRFLFRDGDNRDHNFEFTFFGAGEFGQDCRVIGDPIQFNNGTIGTPSISVLGRVDRFATFSFSGATSMDIQYDSRFNSFETNYTGSTRLSRDRMELLPTGEWVRRANAGITYQWLAGLRYFDLTENINWRARNITSDLNGGGVPADGTPLDNDNGVIDFRNANGQYLIRTSNDLFGLQMGGGFTYEGARGSIGVLNKIGILANNAKRRGNVTFVDAGPDNDPISAAANTSGSAREAELSFLTELAIVGRYHVRPNISLRAGYHMLFLTQVALAPEQIDFNPTDFKVSSNGESFYHGISSGIDFYW